MSGLRLLIMAVHDVAPPCQSAVEDICAALGHIGVSRRVLKVVPNWFGAHPLDQAPDLVALVRAAHDRGDQLVLHGWEHRVHGALRGGMVKVLRGAAFAPLAAEFLTLDAEESAVAVEHGLAVVNAAGLSRPSTFCAPGWLMSREAERGVRAAGLRQELPLRRAGCGVCLAGSVYSWFLDDGRSPSRASAGNASTEVTDAGWTT